MNGENNQLKGITSNINLADARYGQGTVRPPQPKWYMQIGPQEVGFKIGVSKRPNAFHRLMQRWILDIRYFRI